jgi:hypothetical protein
MVLLAVGGMAVPGPSALAAPGCGDEETMFPPDSYTSTVQGDSAEMRVSTHGLANCSGQFGSEFHATVHINNTNGQKFVEDGYVQDNYGNFHAFEEGNDGSAPPGQASFGGFLTGRSIHDPGSNPYFTKIWLNTVNQTTTWKFWIDEYMNGNQVTVSASHPTFDANFTLGYDYGEIGRRGGAGTGASDQHEALKYLGCGSSCTWHSWPNNLSASGICNWDYEHLSATSFDDTKNGPTC